MLISKGKLKQNSLAGQTAIVTGAGGGIGFEAARSLIWLGARVVVAEVNAKKGREAEKRLIAEFGRGTAKFVPTDVADERSVARLATATRKAFGSADIVINNATIAPLGLVADLAIDNWDASYGVNLRGPVLMARAFLPGMVKIKRGVFACVSSVAQAGTAGYEVMKAAQVALANTLDAELEGTGVSIFTIGPGFVPTETAKAGLEKLASIYGKTVQEVYDLIPKEQVLSVEAAGASFAAAVALADRFRGQEIGGIQALIAAGIPTASKGKKPAAVKLTAGQFKRALALCRAVRKTLSEQSDGWKQRSIFERQWMLRDFKHSAGMAVEQWLEVLERLEGALTGRDAAAVSELHAPLAVLAKYYSHMMELAKGYEKNPAKLAENLRIIGGWQDEAENLAKILAGGS